MGEKEMRSKSFTYRVDARDVCQVRPFRGKGWMVFTWPGKCSLAENGVEYPIMAGDDTQLLVSAAIEIVCSDCAPRPCLFVLQEKGAE